MRSASSNGFTDIPGDLLRRLQTAGLAEFFADCTPSHRREYLKWIGEAKRPETRERRIEAVLKTVAAKELAERSRERKRAAPSRDR